VRPHARFMARGGFLELMTEVGLSCETKRKFKVTNDPKYFLPVRQIH